MVDVAGSGIDNKSQGTRGGSDSSLEKNNVYGIEPKVYTGAAVHCIKRCAKPWPSV